jgi:hypothetical protein
MAVPALARPIFTSEKAAIGSNGVFVTQILVLGLIIDVYITKIVVRVRDR